MGKRIFIGVEDICGQIGDFRRAYEKMGYKTLSLSYTKNQSFNAENKYSFVLYDIYPSFILNSKNIFFIFIRKIISFFIVKPFFYMLLFYSIFICDIYIFMWLIESKWKFILWFLNKLDKKIFVMFVGSDIRWRPLAIQDYKMNSIDFSPQFLEGYKKGINHKLFEKSIRTLRVCEKYADSISSTPDQSQLSLRPYISFGLPIDFQNINFNIPNNDVPLVSIGISEPFGKGSYLILERLQTFQLKSNITLKLIVIENMTHKESLSILSESDIFVYSPFGLSAGKFGYEAMAAGALLLTSHDHKYVKYPAEEPPLVHITSKDMIEKLKYYLEHKDEREDLIKKARIWVEKYCNEEFVYKKILDCLENKNYYDIKPEYFRDYANFTDFSGSNKYLECCNKWTKYVKDCDWYNEYVKPGERDGLVF